MKRIKVSSLILDLLVIGVFTALLSAAVTPIVHLILSKGSIVLLETLILCIGLMIIAINVTLYTHATLGPMTISWVGNVLFLAGVMFVAPFLPADTIVQTFVGIWLTSIIVIGMNIVKRVYIIRKYGVRV